MVPLVIFTLLFALTLVRIEQQLQTSLLLFFRVLTEAMLVIVRWVLLLATVGVLALASAVGARAGLSVAGALAHYVVVAAAAPLQVTPTSAGIVLPLAVSLFRAASAAASVAVAVYLAHLHGLSLGLVTLLLGALVAVPVSLAAVGLPAQVSFFAVIGSICSAMGVPISLVPLLLAVGTIPDIFRTFGNVTADFAVLRIAARGSSESLNDGLEQDLD